MTNTRIALVLAEAAGGLARHVRALSRELAGRGAAVTVVGPAIVAGYAPDEAEFVEMRTRGLFAPAALVRTLAGHDLVACHGIRAGLTGCAAARRAGVAARVVTIHTAVLGGPLWRLTGHVAQILLARRSTTRICVSEQLAEAARRMKGSPVVMIPVGAEITEPDSRAVRESRAAIMSGDPRGKLVIAVGRLHRDKGLDVLIEAMSLLPAEDLTALIVGDGPERARLEALASRRAPRVVRFAGYRPDAPVLIAGADVFCMPSRSEGSPLALHEAMAAGRPIVATRVGGIPSMVDLGAAILVEPEDPVALARAIWRLLNERELAERLGAEAKRAAAAWPDARRSAEMVADLYQGLLAMAPSD